MAALADFLPLVGQHCTNAPSVSIEFWVRQAAIEFCQRTLAHQAALPSFNTVVNQPAYALSCGTGLQPTKLLACRINGQRMRLVTPAEMDRLPDLGPASGAAESVYLSGTSALTLHPAPAAVVPVLVRVALQPTQTAATIDDDLFARYAAAIAYGAVAKLAMTPDGRDDQLARAMTAMFDDEIGKAAATTFFNRARSGPRVTPNWF